MEKLLLNVYVHSLWNVYIQNNTALGISVTQGLHQVLAEFWDANVNANVPAKDLPSATLDNLYELVSSQSADALAAVKAIL